MKVYKLKNTQWQYWYDRSYRCWFAAEFDKEGNQLATAIDAYSLDELLDCIRIQGE